jgi:beta-aspartyl-peptidase (threonine type)
MSRIATLTLSYLGITILSLVCPALSIGQANPLVERQTSEITAVLTQQQTAWNAGDIPGFMQGYWKSPQVSFSGSSGVSRGWEAVLARYERVYPNRASMGHLDFSEVEIRPLSDSAALVLGKWHLTLSNGEMGGVFSLVFQRFPEGWKIIHDHTSLVDKKLP